MCSHSASLIRNLWMGLVFDGSERGNSVLHWTWYFRGPARQECLHERIRARFLYRLLGDNNVLKAMLWQESTWRQFSKSGKPLKNTGSSARGVGQIMEYFWADSEKISHSDYLRMAWQWDYNLKAVLEIFKYYQSLVRKAHPGVSLEKLTDWTIYIYHRGPEHLKDQIDPATYDYVAKTRRLMVEKPWEE